MMKKYCIILAVVAMMLVSSLAFAADVSVSGSMHLRSRNFRDFDFDKNTGSSSVYTRERVRLNVNVKAGDVKGKVTIENDWDNWGKLEEHQATTSVATNVTNTTTGAVSTTKVSRLGFREAWMSFPVPGLPVSIKGGHMFLRLGNGWFFDATKYGSDAWLALTEIGPLHLVLFDVKVSEGDTSQSDDIDAYGIVVTNKFGDITAGIDLTMANDRRNVLGFNTAGYQTQAQNLGLNFNGKLGPVGLKAELDVQQGKAKGATTEAKFKGNQIVVQGNVKLEPVTVNFTVARGSGDKIGGADIKRMVTFVDNDPHYTILYEYQIAGPCGTHTGFCNTTALSGGAMFAATKNLTIGGDLWFLQATEKVTDKTSATGGTTNELGMEVDLILKWKMAENLSLKWNLGYLDPGKGLGKDPASGSQATVTMKF